MPGAAGPSGGYRAKPSGRQPPLVSRPVAGGVSRQRNEFGPGARQSPHAIMQISSLRTTLQLTLALAPTATAPSVVGKCSAMFGNGRPLTSRRFQDLAPTPIRTIRSRGLENARYCAAAAGRRVHGLPGRAIATSFRPIATTSLPASVPVPCSALVPVADRLAAAWLPRQEP